jgi:hypothetical protein
MADLLPLIELELRIALLPPISRGAHLGGPRLHAQRLVDLWKIGGGDDVLLVQAFRLLDADVVAGAILRTTAAGDCPGDPRHWVFPPLADLLPELHALAWQAVLEGALLITAIKGVRGTRRRRVLLAELPRLRPDWRLSRLVHDERDGCDGCDGQIGGWGSWHDEFIDVRVRRTPAESIKATWRHDKRSQEAVNDAMDEIAKGYLPAEEYLKGAPRPAFDEIWGKLKTRCGKDVTREQARNALLERAPHLRGRKGYSSKK